MNFSASPVDGICKIFMHWPLKQRTVRYKICDKLFTSYLRVLLCILSQKGVSLLYVAAFWLFLILLMRYLLYMHFKTEYGINLFTVLINNQALEQYLQYIFISNTRTTNFQLETIIKCKDLKFLQVQ